MQTNHLVPNGSDALLLSYTMKPWPEEEGLPPALAHALAEGLTTWGTVAGRWFDDGPPPDDSAVIQPEPRGMATRAVERILNKWPAAVIATRSPDAVVALLNQGWAMQYQALLMLDARQDQQPDQALRSLASLRDWTAFTFPAPAVALIAPGVDGDAVMLATPSAGSSALLLCHLATVFDKAGFVLPTELLG